MSGAGPTPPPDRARPTRRAAFLATLLVALSALVYASFVRVPEGSHAFRSVRGGTSFVVLDPGLHVSVPILHEIKIVLDTVEAEPAPAAGPLLPARRLEHPIVIIGVDGADWQIAEPLMRAGRLPVLARLREGGARGHLRSSAPMLSPLLWTTAATGKPPDEHGIVDFLVPDPATGTRAPISSRSRRVKALWNIFSDRGYATEVVGWWATYPAEEVRGVIVSDRLAYSLFDVEVGRSTGGLVSPRSYESAALARLVRPEEIADAEVRRIAGVSDDDLKDARQALASHRTDASKDRLVHLLKILASTRTYHGIALHLLERGQPDLFAVYYQGIDEVSHRFAHCTAPALPLCDPRDAARFGGAVAAFYEYQDALLGEILNRIDPRSYVVVLSDHGFRSGGDRPRDLPPDIEGKPAKWHRPYGIALVSGPGVSPSDFESVTLLDIAPTVLRLAGLPRASDMPGHALLDPPDAPVAPAGRIASYEGEGRPVEAASVTSESDEAMLENLRSLGYIGGTSERTPPSAPGAPSPKGFATPSSVTAHTNVGALHLQKGETEAAEKELVAALEIAPDYFPALMGLAEVRVRQGKIEEGLRITRRAMESSRDPDPGVYLRYIFLARKAGSTAEASSVLERIRKDRPAVAEIPVALAMPALEMGRTAEAEALLREAIAIDPVNPEATSRLFQLKRKTGREADLEPEIRRALAANPNSLLHRNWLGLILERRGDFAGAEKEFKAALDVAPDFGGMMANLGSLYGRSGRLPEAVALLEKALRIDPENLECRVNLGAALGKLGRTDDALRILEGGLPSGEGSPPLLNALAVAHAQKGDLRGAGDLLRRSLAINPDQREAREMLQEIDRGP